MDAELGRHLLQGLAALLEPLDRLGLVLGGEPPPLALLRHRPLPMLVEPTLRRCPSSQGRLRRPFSPLPRHGDPARGRATGGWAARPWPTAPAASRCSTRSSE